MTAIMCTSCGLTVCDEERPAEEVERRLSRAGWSVYTGTPKCPDCAVKQTRRRMS